MPTSEEEKKEFLDLCRDGDLETLEYLLEDNPDLVNSSSYGMIINIILPKTKNIMTYNGNDAVLNSNPSSL